MTRVADALKLPPDQRPVGLRDGLPFAPNGLAEAAEHLRKAFQGDAVAVARRWAAEADLRWGLVADILERSEAEAGAGPAASPAEASR